MPERAEEQGAQVCGGGGRRGGAAGVLERGGQLAPCARGRHRSTVQAMLARKRVRAHGRVQGVFFRDSVRRAAQQRGVAGWATNCPDGTVEAVFEGDPAAVDRLVELCRAGPGRAVVERLEVVDEEPEGLAG